MQGLVPKGRANYEPNSLSEAGEIGGPRECPARGFRSAAVDTGQAKARERSATFSDHYSQARLFWRSQSEIEQAHLASAIVFELSKTTLEVVRTRVLANLGNVDKDLATRVAQGLGLKAPPTPSKAARKPVDMDPSPALRLIGKYPETLNGRAVGILVADGSDGDLVEALRASIEDAGAQAKIVAPKINVILKGGDGMVADAQLPGAPSVIFDAVAIALSEAGCESLMTEAKARDFIADAFAHLKTIAYTPQAQPLLDKAGVEPDEGVIELDGKDVSAFISAAATRQWAREAKVRMLA
jgi:catalase